MQQPSSEGAGRDHGQASAVPGPPLHQHWQQRSNDGPQHGIARGLNSRLGHEIKGPRNLRVHLHSQAALDLPLLLLRYRRRVTPSRLQLSCASNTGGTAAGAGRTISTAITAADSAAASWRVPGQLCSEVEREATLQRLEEIRSREAAGAGIKGHPAKREN